jgi:hypothetical protein
VVALAIALGVILLSTEKNYKVITYKSITVFSLDGKVFCNTSSDVKMKFNADTLILTYENVNEGYKPMLYGENHILVKDVHGVEFKMFRGVSDDGTLYLFFPTIRSSILCLRTDKKCCEL